MLPGHLWIFCEYFKKQQTSKIPGADYVSNQEVDANEYITYLSLNMERNNIVKQ